MITVEKKIVIFRQYIRYSIKSMRTYLCSIYIDSFFVKKTTSHSPPSVKNLEELTGFVLGLNYCLRCLLLKKMDLFEKSKWRIQDGSQNKQNRVKKKDGKPSEELHD